MGSWFIILSFSVLASKQGLETVNEALSVERRRNILFSGHTLFGLKCHTSTLTFLACEQALCLGEK